VPIEPERPTGDDDEPFARASSFLSIIVPIYNEARCIDQFFAKLLPVLDGSQCPYEIICVDDGSKDDSAALIREWMNRDVAIKLIKLTRNFGKERALAAGIDHAKGDATIPIDVDLQDPPEIIIDLIDRWQQGYDMVAASRRNRPGDTRIKRQSANWFYRIMNRFSEVSLPAHAGDFRLLDRRVVDALKRLPESARFHKGLFAWVGFNTCIVEFDRGDRVQGNSKWSYWKLWNFALDGIFSFSTAPLKLWSYMGVITACAGFIYAAFIVVRTLIYGTDVPGYASLLVLLLVLNGFSMIGIGVVGEYVGRIFAEVKNRPLYLVDSIEQTRTAAAGHESGVVARR
jgi:glycosyltransferase involved in cell wall biosynthesis